MVFLRKGELGGGSQSMQMHGYLKANFGSIKTRVAVCIARCAVTDQKVEDSL